MNDNYPLHDGICRCRVCKPSLVGERSQWEFEQRMIVATFIFFAVIVLLAFCA